MTACSRKDAVQFCEGVDFDGKGVKCGKKFTTGELTGVIRQSKPFETEVLDLKVIRIEKSSKFVEKTVHVKVDREKMIANMNLKFYNPGRYTVELYRDREKLGDGSVEIADPVQ